jgi:hypothetical protein
MGISAWVRAASASRRPLIRQQRAAAQWLQRAGVRNKAGKNDRRVNAIAFFLSPWRYLKLRYSHKPSSPSRPKNVTDPMSSTKNRKIRHA